MQCPQCSQELPDGAKFCLECGANISDASKESGVEGELSMGGMLTMEPSPQERAPEVSMGKLVTMQGAGGESSDRLDLTGVPLSDRYEVLEEIGRGGFAVVHKARDKRLGRIVAVKRLLDEEVNGPQAQQTIERFVREARAIATLNHRNIVQVYDHNRDDEGHYIVMEYVDGGTLRDLLKERGKLPVSEAIALIKGIGQGLSVAHKHNLVHRDIKPGNILLAHEGEDVIPKVVDFGLARAGPDSTTSMTGYGMGTPYYMPPEQRRDAKSVNHTADIYALGKTLYELVTGDIPDNVDPEAIPQPAQLSRIITKAIKSRPEERYFSVDEFLQELDRIRSVSSVSGVSSGDAASANTCPNCGNGNPDDVKFCESCGSGLTRLCPECERENSIHKKYCGSCGTDVAGFLQVQEAIERMAKSSSEKKWSRVTKESGLLPEDLRLPGAKGKKLKVKLREQAAGAAAKIKQRDEIEKQLKDALDKEDFEEALDLVAKHQNIDPSNDEVNALPDGLAGRIDERDYATAEREAVRLEREHCVTEAVAACKGYIVEHAKGMHAQEARDRIRELEDVLLQVEGLVAEGEELAKADSLEQALDLWRRALGMDRKRKDVASLIGDCEQSLERWQKARERAQKTFDAGKYEEAVELWRSVKALRPSDTDAEGQTQQAQRARLDHLRQRARGHLANKYFEQALHTLDAALEIAPDDPELTEWRKDAQRTFDQMEAALNEAREHLKSDNKKAIDACNRVMDIDSDSSEAQRLLSRAQKNLASSATHKKAGEQFFKKGDFVHAIQEWEKAKAVHAADPFLDKSIAAAKLADSQLKSILQEAEKALAGSRLQGCSRLCQRALKISPVHQRATEMLAKIRPRLRRLRAKRVFTSVLLLVCIGSAWYGAHRALDAWNQRCVTQAKKLALQGMHGKALACYERTIGIRYVVVRPIPPQDWPSATDGKPERSRTAPSTRSGLGPLKGEPWTVPGLGMQFVPVAAGSFKMGSNDGSSDEKPVHMVRITGDFWLGKYEVTQVEYEALMGRNPSHFKGARNPVETVSWEDASAYCAKLTARERSAGRLPSGYEYRLPTEAEWEYAARGGTKSKGFTYAGSEKVGDVAWYSENSGGTTHAVGGKGANEVGLYDMSGNVWEWCLDWYDAEYYKKTNGASDPVNLQKASYRVIRGGCWCFSAGLVRSANRDGDGPSAADGDLGFRVCLARVVR